MLGIVLTQTFFTIISEFEVSQHFSSLKSMEFCKAKNRELRFLHPNDDKISGYFY